MMYWEHSPQWNGWFLMIQVDGTTAKQAYGPFMNDWEIRTAADVHGVPFSATHQGDQK